MKLNSSLRRFGYEVRKDFSKVNHLLQVQDDVTTLSTSYVTYLLYLRDLTKPPDSNNYRNELLSCFT